MPAARGALLGGCDRLLSRWTSEAPRPHDVTVGNRPRDLRTHGRQTGAPRRGRSRSAWRTWWGSTARQHGSHCRAAHVNRITEISCDNRSMPMRTDCKNYESRTYPGGETVRKCNLDLAPEAPWRCPANCSGLRPPAGRRQLGPRRAARPAHPPGAARARRARHPPARRGGGHRQRRRARRSCASCGPRAPATSACPGGSGSAATAGGPVEVDGEVLDEGRRSPPTLTATDAAAGPAALPGQRRARAAAWPQRGVGRAAAAAWTPSPVAAEGQGGHARVVTAAAVAATALRRAGASDARSRSGRAHPEGDEAAGHRRP